VALKLAVVAGVAVLAAVTLRADAVSQPARDVLMAVVLLGLWARIYVVRPQLFSLLLFAMLLWVLRSAERGHVRRLWILPVLFASWVNLHGGWIVGMAALAVWTAARFTPWNDSTAPARAVIGAAAISLAATFVNPYGVDMWTFLADTVRVDRPNINDWRPLVSSGPEVVIPWIASAALALVAFTRRRPRIPIGHAVIVFGLAAGSFRVNRLDAFFTLSVVMLLGRQTAGTAHARAPEGRPAWTLKPIVVAAVLAVAGAAAAVELRSRFTCLALDGPWMPEREAGAFIMEHHLHGRLLTWFDWGEYAIWHFAPDLKVSLDGRRETVYSEAFVAKHARLYFEPRTERDLLHWLNADYAWLPVSLPLVAVLKEERWSTVFTGPKSVVMARAAVSMPARERLLSESACFPGP
jgi:hypothetical protein